MQYQLLKSERAQVCIYFYRVFWGRGHTDTSNNRKRQYNQCLVFLDYGTSQELLARTPKQ